MNDFLGRNGLYLAWLVSIVATAGSLYFSEIRQFTPCQLCWIQRIFMYPHIILFGIASYHGDQRIARYSLPLAILGGLFALYHVLEQNIAILQEHSFCQAGVSCSGKYINWLGFISIPVLSLTAFTVITILMLAVWKYSKIESQQTGISEN
jgi:disulfide bond formation protein DsbB